MEQIDLKSLCKKQIDESIDRMHYLCADGRSDDATALYEEIREWVSHKEDIQVMSLDYLNLEFDNS